MKRNLTKAENELVEGWLQENRDMSDWCMIGTKCDVCKQEFKEGENAIFLNTGIVRKDIREEEYHIDNGEEDSRNIACHHECYNRKMREN